jgi:hypothetical protein
MPSGRRDFAVRNFRLPPRCTWDILSSETQRGVERYFCTDFSGPRYGNTLLGCVRSNKTADRKRIRLSPKRPDRLWGPRSLIFKGYHSPFAEVMQPRRDVDPSTPPYSYEVKNEWSCISTPPIRRHVMNSDKSVYINTFGTNSHFTQRGHIIEWSVDFLTFATLLVTRRMWHDAYLRVHNDVHNYYLKVKLAKWLAKCRLVGALSPLQSTHPIITATLLVWINTDKSRQDSSATLNC